MDFSFQDSPTLPLDTIRTVIGNDTCAWLETQKDRIVFIVMVENTIQIYQNQNIKNFFEFDVNVANNLTCRLTNAESKIKPLIIVSNITFSLTLSPKSHGELLLIEGTSESAQYKHQILLEENAHLASAWLFIQPRDIQPRDRVIPRLDRGTQSINTHTQDVQLERLVEIKKNGVFYDAQIFAPQSNTQVHSKIKLTEEFAQSFSAGCVLADYGQLHYEPIQEHFAMHGKSFLNFKVVLAKRAKSFFRGLVILHKDAQKSEAYQENKNLLLSRTARADSEPRLEIIPNDVMCKHGSATAEMDSKQLYYLMSRGFENHEAKTMIVKSFCNAAFLQQTESHFLQTLVPFVTDHLFNSHSEIIST